MDFSPTQRSAGVDPQQYDPATLARMAAALPLIVRMLDGWQITRKDQADLIKIDIRILQLSWKDEASGLTQDQVARLLLLAGIYQALHRIFPEAAANAWFTTPQTGPPYNGQTPLRYTQATGVSGLFDTRKLLEAAAFGNFFSSAADRRKTSRIQQPDFDLSANS